MLGQYRTYQESPAEQAVWQNGPDSAPSGPGGEAPNLARGGQYELPICLFGPGEGYYRPWPGQEFQPGRASIALRRVLARISHWLKRQQPPVPVAAELNAAGQPALGPLAPRVGYEDAEASLADESQTVRAAESPALAGHTETPTHRLMWELNYERNAEANGNLAPDKRLPGQTWLFADHAGIGQQFGRQQSNGLSAHRSSRRKRAAAKVTTQGTLFGT